MVGRFPSTPGNNQKQWRFREHEAEQLYQAEMRHFIAGKSAEGLSDVEIGKLLQVPPRIVKAFREMSFERVKELHMAGIDPTQAHKVLPVQDVSLTRVRVSKGPGAGTHRRLSKKGQALRDSMRFKQQQQQAWMLRKRAMPYDGIAKTLRISETEARHLVKTRADELDLQELESAEQARLLMVEQIDAMMQALMTDATGVDDQGQERRVIYEAIDRMVKLMDAKAKLLGLNKANKVDLTIRLKAYADEQGYDYDEVKEVAAEVITAMSRRD